MATPQPESQVVPLQGATPFVGGEVFNPANFVRITNLDEASWGRFVPGSIVQGGAPPLPIWITGPGKLAKQAIHGRYNGRDYLFPYGQPVNVPVDVARHIFGFLLDDKSGALSRLGWARTSDEVTEALERLGNIRFEDLPELMEAARFVQNAAAQPPPVDAHASGLVKGVGVDGGAKAPPETPVPKRG